MMGMELPMSTNASFNGFMPETVKFFTDLKKNNTREWFESNRWKFEKFVLDPARTFVVEIGLRLREISPRIIAEPKVNGSIFRIFRDTRFGADKSPYKTNMGIYFWEGRSTRLECSGFYFHLEPPGLMLGAGVYMFPRHKLGLFRRVAVDPEYGDELSGIIKDIKRRKGYDVSGEFYKRIPAGFDPEHPNAGLLLHNGLYAGFESPIPKSFYSKKLVDDCFEKFNFMAPLHRWLVSLLAGEIQP
jgi:uncharacterized protein (TIGR02453 family)